MTTYEQIPLLHECTCGAQVNFPLAADGRRLCACSEELDEDDDSLDEDEVVAAALIGTVSIDDDDGEY